jgi:hypothetical protein
MVIDIYAQVQLDMFKILYPTGVTVHRRQSQLVQISRSMPIRCQIRKSPFMQNYLRETGLDMAIFFACQHRVNH